jgi:pSer/pThr/pTyr-binding forkhead associated (FHA) protein
MSGTIRARVVREPGAAARLVRLDGDVITIGRDLTCTIQLVSPYASRYHARIERRGEGAALIDLGSRNGSQLNGLSVVSDALFRPGDVLTIGDATIEALDMPAQRSKTLTPRQEAPEPPVADRLRVDPQLYEVSIGGRRLERRVSRQEFALLRYLYEHRGRVCARNELGDAVWGADQWDYNMLHRLVHRLKEKVEPTSERPRYVQTVPQFGYRLTP